jgi:hypothetical protein
MSFQWTNPFLILNIRQHDGNNSLLSSVSFTQSGSKVSAQGLVSFQNLENVARLIGNNIENTRNLRDIVSSLLIVRNQ